MPPCAHRQSTVRRGHTLPLAIFPDPPIFHPSTWRVLTPIGEPPRPRRAPLGRGSQAPPFRLGTTLVCTETFCFFPADANPSLVSCAFSRMHSYSLCFRKFH